MNAPSTYRYPLYVLVDDDYAIRGSIEWDGGRYIGRETNGSVIFDRADFAGAKRQAQTKYNIVSSAWYDVPTGLPSAA